MPKANLIDEGVHQAHWRVIIIGTGFGGLGMAISLKKNGINNFLVLDKAGEVGGVWRDNSYPGAACDVRSQLYSFSFEPNPNWSHTFARQNEIFTYLRHCADKYGIYQYIRFRSEVIKAEFKDDQQLWVVTLSDGSTLATQFLVTATGQLSLPYIPEIEGHNSFLGHSFHSAQWDHEFPIENKRVAVIGTGASSIQIAPAIANQVKELLLFQRSAPYVLPRGDRVIPSWLKKLYSAAPLIMSLQRLRFYLQYELRGLSLTLFKRLLTL